MIEESYPTGKILFGYIIISTIITILVGIITLNYKDIHYLFDLKFSLADIFTGIFILLEVAIFGTISSFASALMALFLIYKKFKICGIFDYITLFIMTIISMLIAIILLTLTHSKHLYSFITNPIFIVNTLIHSLSILIITKIVIPKG